MCSPRPPRRPGSPASRARSVCPPSDHLKHTLYGNNNNCVFRLENIRRNEIFWNWGKNTLANYNTKILIYILKIHKGGSRLIILFIVILFHVLILRKITRGYSWDIIFIVVAVEVLGRTVSRRHLQYLHLGGRAVRAVKVV